MKYIFIVGLLAFFYLEATAQQDISWKEEIILDGTFKYIRLCKVTKGEASGDLIMTYFKSNHSAPFGMRRSADNGRTWTEESVFMRNNDTYYYVNPGILQLDDGRLMLSYCRRSKGENQYITDEGPCVRFSDDGGYTWGDETFITMGGSYEPTAIQVPNDKNGDGINDIYIFWSMAIIDHTVELSLATRANSYMGIACGMVASYDGGLTWDNFMTGDQGGRILHRNFDEVDGNYMGSKGNMPTPVLLPDYRIGVVCEAVKKRHSPWFTISDKNDWDWENFQGQFWTSHLYYGYPPHSDDDDNVYPLDRDKCWRPTFKDDTFGGAPYTCVLPNGKIAFSQNSAKKIKVFVADAYGKNAIEQINPYGDARTFYSCIVPLEGNEVIIAAHAFDDLSKAYIRIGEVEKDIIAPSVPENVTWSKNDDHYDIQWTPSVDNIIVHKYEVYANGERIKTVLWDNFARVEDAGYEDDINFKVRAVDYQGNYSENPVNVNDPEIVRDIIKITPTVADDIIHIQTKWDNYIIRVFSIDGKQVVSDRKNISQLNVSELSKGAYLLSIEHKKYRQVKRFIKK